MWAVRFDRETLTTVGEPVQAVPRVSAPAITGAAHFDFSLNGSLTYLTEGTPALDTLGWVDRDGQMTEVVMEAAAGFKAPRLSPDGTRVALRRFGRANGIYVHPLPAGPETWLSPSPETVRISPVWTPDGSNVVFSALKSGSWGLESTRIDQPGEPEVLLDFIDAHNPSWGGDGKSFAFYVTSPNQGSDIWRVDAEGVPHVFLASEFDETSPRLSPNGRWVAYVSDQPGEDRVFVQTFPEATETLWVSPGYGTEPVWSQRRVRQG